MPRNAGVPIRQHDAWHFTRNRFRVDPALDRSLHGINQLLIELSADAQSPALPAQTAIRDFRGFRATERIRCGNNVVLAQGLLSDARIPHHKDRHVVIPVGL